MYKIVSDLYFKFIIQQQYQRKRPSEKKIGLEVETFLRETCKNITYDQKYFLMKLTLIKKEKEIFPHI